MSARNALVIGAGVNGLVAAVRLGQAGGKVTVLEARDVPGGLAAGEEFAPGYHDVGLLHDTTGLRTRVVDALHLHGYGLVWRDAPPSVYVAEPDGQGVWLHADPDRGAEAIAERSEEDAESYRSFRRFVRDVRKAVEPVLSEPLPDLIGPDRGDLVALLKRGLAVRRLGADTMMQLARIAPMCVADWAGEWFRDPLVRVGVSAPALLHSANGPWSPGTAANLLMALCAEAPGVYHGPQALVAALLQAGRAVGVNVRTGARVEAITVEDGVARGVRLAGGETLSAPTVLAACDPRHTFLDLVASRDLPYRVERGAQLVRGNGTTFVVRLALSGPLEFAGAPGQRVERARVVGANVDDLERSFDPVKYRRFSTQPSLEIYVPTVEQPELAPEGHEVVTIHAHYAPYDLDGGWTEAVRASFADLVVTRLASVAPSVTRRITARQVLAPPDLERVYGAGRGHLFHGDHALDQLLFRPMADCAGYFTPVPGLVLGGSGSWPGGGLTAGPGYLAAGAILES